MASMQEEVRTLLGAASGVTTLVGTRIFPGQVPDDEDPTPWLYYAVPQSEPQDLIGGVAGVRSQVEFHSMADTYAVAKGVIDAVKVVLNGYVKGTLIVESHWQGTAEEVTEDGYHHVARFQIDARS